MTADTHRDPTGRVKQTPFRFAADTLAHLDDLAAAMTAESGVTHSRADTIRVLVRRECDRRKKNSEKKSGS